MVIFAIALVALIAFIGLAIDAGSIYVTYGQLKRAVDAAAVAAANDFKRPDASVSLADRVNKMKAAAEEVLVLHNISKDTVNLQLYICDVDGDGVRDTTLQTTAPEFYQRCPPPGQPPRKLVWLDAQQEAPLYFLNVIGFQWVTLHTTAISEAAPVDIMIVIDISESMADESRPGQLTNNYDPNTNLNPGGIAGCNMDDSCQPLKKAKDAAKALVDAMYDNYDRVGVVTFDKTATVVSHLDGNLSNVKSKIDAIKLYDELPGSRIWGQWLFPPPGSPFQLNYAFPDDRDGDGQDADLPACTMEGEERWDYTLNTACDDPNVWDAYNWDNVDLTNYSDDYLWEPTDDGNLASSFKSGFTYYEYASDYNSFTVENYKQNTPLSTCTGCGIRVGTDLLKLYGRPGSVWVMVFLSDGYSNLSDTPDTYTYDSSTGSGIPSSYPNGFCTSSFWGDLCGDEDYPHRYCIEKDDPLEPNDGKKKCYYPCNLNAGETGYQASLANCWQSAIPNPNYSVLDYALDMVDSAALTFVKGYNENEPPGEDIAIYTIGLGGVANTTGESLLRYMAKVGDDGDRMNLDECATTPGGQSCGNYYYAPDGNKLLDIFEDIGTRIYTRISQ